MRKEWNIALIIIFAIAISSAMAQTFPVRVTPVLTPPYTPFLTDYTDPGAERLTLQIMLNDLTVTEFRTKLRMTIEGVGITITSNPNYVPPPISLQGGVPQLIYGSDIAGYFKMSNLVFQGLNPNEVQKNGGRLPEGIYRISFEVLDYNRNTVVSNKGSATAWMILNDPPFINLPVNNAKIKPLNPQNIVFQWTPRHRGSPNAAFTTDYDVKLVEIWPAGRNPFDAINTSRPIFEATTSATMVVYGPAETPLVLGREYALQVRARDNGGRDVFKNNGYSEVVRFIYGDECPMPSGLNADDINVSKARMRWQGNGQNSDYLLRYREKKEGARWFEEKTHQSYYNVNGLRPGTTYEYTLAGECDIYQSDFTGIQSFTTLAENPNAFVCADPNAVNIDGSPPLPALFTNDFIHAGGFDVVVNKATGSNGRFSGEGLAVVPWFNSAKVRVTFENIGVNTSHQLTAGEIKSVWDPNSSSLIQDKKQDFVDGQKNVDDKTNLTASLITFEGTIDSVYVNPEGKIVVIDSRGNEIIYEQPVIGSTKEKRLVEITDSGGNTWGVDKEGKVSEGGFGIGKSDSNGIGSHIIMQRELIRELLESIKREIILRLENNGKGPLDDEFLRKLLSIPDCLPKDEAQLESVLVNINYYLMNLDELLDLVKEDEVNKNRIEELVGDLNAENTSYREDLSDEEWDELVQIICPYLANDRNGIIFNSPITSFVDDNYYLKYPEKTRFSEGDTIIVYYYMEGVTLNVEDVNNQVINLDSENMIGIEGVTWPPGFIVNIVELEKRTVKGFKIQVPEVDTLQLYVVKVSLSSNAPSFDIDESDVEDVADNCTTWSTNNNTGYTCNFCVRDAFYKITGSTILYPGGSNSCLCCDPEESGLAGLVNGNGTANTIYNTLADKNSDLAQYFEEIYDITDEDYPDFTRIQEDVNDGQMIIGVLARIGPGHIVLLMPENLWNGTGTRDEVALTNGDMLQEPFALECGNATDKRVKPLSGFGSVTSNDFKNIKWFRYTGL